MSIGNRTSRRAGTLGVFVKRYGRNAQTPLEPNDRRDDHDVERTMRRLSPADRSDPPADDDGSADDAEAGFADARRMP
ncbi:hypothetical protein BLA23254_06594 [Burkholderia lata]|uniref:Uncharacterized protein n=1 Tax=Burkholderia lata (strain ATCC 17760 / DSM 23089 / LMG 22485 / NCIMB 9086 / R18194 / 383) TaxID=482957 RepID=A0A6P2RYN7_BURL3|nr:hypothetical protein [Burkholderia lata]VWC35225.1 hypothetical protein BLA23254_06594 [Burkholderia lata]